MRFFLKKLKLINQIGALAKQCPNDFEFGYKVRILIREFNDKKKN